VRFPYGVFNLLVLTSALFADMHFRSNIRLKNHGPLEIIANGIPFLGKVEDCWKKITIADMQLWSNIS
jgi:hypothetical protein